MINYEPSNRLRIIFSYRGTILPSIMTYELGILIWTTFLILSHNYLDGFGFEMGGQLHTFLGVALVFLLVMRTNASYDRYWEGRKKLGELGIIARNIAIKSNAIIPKDEKGCLLYTSDAADE